MQSVSVSNLVVGKTYVFTAPAGDMGTCKRSGVFVRIENGVPFFYTDSFKAESIVCPQVWTFFEA
jgi:hypothetical protein